MSDEQTLDFLSAIRDANVRLISRSFKRYSYKEKGYTYYIRFKKEDSIVEFIWGPPEFQIEMILYVGSLKYAFKDLLKIPEIGRWVSSNRYKQGDKRNVKSEMLWFLDLLQISLEVIGIK
ncbi:MAG TPA: hypothetical protein VHA56_02750 [Mucilaginibacter sp.]|nr:hypothetical protein [Mucilaginibacter sp.]